MCKCGRLLKNGFIIQDMSNIIDDIRGSLTYECPNCGLVGPEFDDWISRNESLALLPLNKRCAF